MLFAAIEIYRFHGASLISLPVDSVLNDILLILRQYERLGLVAIEKWTDVNIGDELQLGYDPNHEVLHFV
jgi:hypothetical protein